MTDDLIKIIIAIISSGAFFTFIQFLITRRDNKKDMIKKLQDSIDDIRKIITRTNLMLLIKEYPDRDEEIMKVAHLYFVDMKGNYYLSTIFESWLKERKIDKPFWYKDLKSK